MTAHARLSPSAAHRWAHCTASVHAIERAQADGLVPHRESNDAADEGTAAHTIREECLQFSWDPHDFIGTSVVVNGKRWPVTMDMAEHLMPGIDWIRERAEPDRLLVEHRAALDPWLPGQFGTIDCAFWWQPDGDSASPVEAVVSDLKYGFGAVGAEGNLQQQIYALGYLEHVDLMGIVDTVRIVIDQPRKGGIKEWVLPKERLLKFGEWIADRGAEALGQGVYRPSEEACRWCPLAQKPGLCAAHDAWVLEPLPIDLDDLDLEDLDTPPALPKPIELTPDLKAWLLRQTPAITGWLKALHADAYADAMMGNPPPGFKLVEGEQGDRTWVDEAAATALLAPVLGDGAYTTPKLISFPQAEKLVKPGRKKPGHPALWEQIKGSFTRSPARPVLVPDNHEKPAYRPATALAADLDDLD